MRTGTSDILSQGHSGRPRLNARLRRARKSQYYRFDLEGLESRTLLATIPAATPTTSSPNQISSLMGNVGGVNASESSSEVAVDPLDPSKLVAVWIDNDPTMFADTDGTFESVLEAAYSTDAGVQWNALLAEPINGLGIPNAPILYNPATNDPIVPYTNVSSPSLGFDDSGNFYILSEYTGGSSGALSLQKYKFTSSIPTTVDFATNFNPTSFAPSNAKVIYQWASSGTDDQAYDPTMAVDDNLATIPSGVASPADPFSGNVYVSWASIDRNTAIPIAPFNPNRITVEVSSDGGNNFGPDTIAGAGNFATEKDGTPALTVSQGRLPTESGVSGDLGITAGQVAVTFDDFGDTPQAILANTISAGTDNSFGGATGSIGIGTTTLFTNTVTNVTSTAADPLDSLDVKVAIVDSNDADLGLTLIAPSGATFTLVLNQVPVVGGTADTGIGISGANVGVVSDNGYAVGTTFTDTATRDIFDSTTTGTNGNSAPYIGDFRPENGETLDEFLAAQLQKNEVNGTWKLLTNDTNSSAPSSPQFIDSWSLNFGHGLEADTPVAVPYPVVGGELGATPIAGGVGPADAVASGVSVPSSAIDIGPGLVMAQDNTLGAYSPYEGRIYAAFVGYINVKVDGFQNPTSNTDIFLTYSDDDGRTWSTPIEVNNDSSATDGITGSNETNLNDEITGNSQYQPEVAVDPTTGTVVLSWRDARNDPANTLVATYIATSIDGGNTFSAQVYANPENQAVDAITDQADVLGPQGDNGTAADNAANSPYGYGTSMGLAVYAGQVYPIWAGNFDQAHFVNNVPSGNALSIYYQPMVIAAGPRIISSTMGPIAASVTGFTGTLTTGSSLVTGVSSTAGLFAGEGVAGPGLPSGVTILAIDSSTSITLSTLATVSGAGEGLTATADAYQQAQQTGQLSFTVTFDRPINPPGTTASFTPADVQVFYQDTSYGDPSIPLEVLSVTPVASSGVGSSTNPTKFGYTQFTIVFSVTTQADGSTPSGITNYTGTYSYLVAPDDGNGNPVAEPIPAFVYTNVAQPVIGPISSSDVPLPVPPPSITGQPSAGDNVTTSTLTIAGKNNDVISGVTVTLSLTAPTQNGNQLFITLTAPDGQTGTVYDGTLFAPAPLDWVNQSFNVPGLADSRVNGTYTLTIVDEAANNTGGSLTAWSVTINSNKSVLVFETGDAMDQNADGTSDENPLNTTQYPDGYLGLTPGDVYAVPTPEVTAPVTFSTAQSILSPPFNQNTVPLIVSGPQVLTTEAIGTSGAGSTGTGDLITNDSTSQFDVTFDRLVQTSSFTASQVVSIIGPAGSILSPQTFSSPSIDQTVPAATGASSPGKLDSTLTIASDDTLQIADITVTLSIASFADSGLTAVLVAPNGDTIPLFSALPGAGQDFINTVFDDSAQNSITAGTAPFTGTFRPEYGASSTTLTDLAGLIADGIWHLQLTNTTTGSSATLDSWSLNITPQVTVTPVASTEKTVNNVQVATEFAIGFPQQNVSGTYTIQLGPDILDEYGDGQDATSSAGLNVLRDEGQNSPTTTIQYSALNLPTPIPPTTVNLLGQSVTGTVSSSIAVPDSFVISGDQTSAGLSVMQVELDVSFASDPDLTATLSHYDSSGDLLGTVILFGGVGSGTNTANFTNTVFDDNAATPIQSGSAPFSAIYNPQESLATVFAPTTGMNVQGTWTLTITNSGTGAATGTLNGWSLTFQKPLPTSGLGEQGSDDASLSFQIFTLSPSDPVSSELWTAVGPASSTDEAGQVNAIAVDPSDPSGNTVYVGGASGGIWKTTDFLTTNPAGPTWVPLTNFGPNSAVNISSITIFPVNDNTNESIIIAATGGASSGEEATDAPGVGFLISMNGGVTWNLYDSTDNVSSVNNTSSEIGDTSNILPINSAARDRKFVGTTAYQVTVDPQLTPTGQVIIYAALSGPNGGIWESENTGQTWTQVLAGNATAVVLDQNSGSVLDPISGGNPSNGAQPGSPTYGGNYQIVYAGLADPSGTGQASGVYMSTNQGQSWTLMTGQTGNPLIVDLVTGKNVNPASQPNPNGGGGKVVLAVPAATNNYLESEMYAGWLYAAVATPSGGFDGLFVTKDFGQNWTQIVLDSLPPLGRQPYNEAVPVQPGDVNANGIDPYAITDNNQGNVDLALTIDPQNPNITYLGGFGGDTYNSDSGLIRVDATNVQDAHALTGVLYDYPEDDYQMLASFYSTGTLTLLTNAWTTIDSVLDGPPSWDSPQYGPLPADYLNFIRNPLDPFVEDSSLYVENIAAFSNSGLGATWTPMDVPTTSQFIPPGSNDEISGTGYQILVTEVDPTTGLTRLMAGNLTGIYSGLVTAAGTFETTVGNSSTAPPAPGSIAMATSISANFTMVRSSQAP